MSKGLYSLILPCYNEAEHFEESSQRIIAAVENSKRNWEIILVDDASTDDTVAKIKILLGQKLPVKTSAIYHPRNLGRGVTVMDGIKKSKGEIVGFIDIDCEIDPRYISWFIEMVEEGFDVVCARRIYELSFGSLLRHITSKAYILVEKKLLGTDFPDTEAGFKFFRRSKIIPLFSSIHANHWFWDTEIMVKSAQKNLRIGFIPTVFERRQDKTSTVRLIPDTISYLRNLLALRREKIR